MEIKNFLFMPEGHKWKVISSYTAESVYSIECCWFNPSDRIAIMDIETGITSIFTRELKPDGTFIVLKKEEITV